MEIEDRLLSPANLANIIDEIRREDNPSAIVVPKPPRGRPVGATSIPKELKELVSIMSNVEKPGTGAEIGRVFGIARSTVNKLKNGTDSGTEAREAVQDKLEKVKDNALDIVLRSTELLPAKLEDAKARDIAAIGRDMAGVYERLSGGRKGENGGVTVTIYAPAVKTERDFGEAITVKATPIP